MDFLLIGKDAEIWHASEVGDVGGDYRHLVSKGGCGNPEIIGADELA